MCNVKALTYYKGLSRKRCCNDMGIPSLCKIPAHSLTGIKSLECVLCELKNLLLYNYYDSTTKENFNVSAAHTVYTKLVSWQFTVPSKLL